MQQQAAADGTAEYQRGLDDGTELPRGQPERQRHDQALVPDVPGDHGFGAVREPAEATVPQHLAPAEAPQQSRPPASRPPDASDLGPRTPPPPPPLPPPAATPPPTHP